jgi:DnaJ-class molecular chaperone
MDKRNDLNICPDCAGAGVDREDEICEMCQGAGEIAT